MIGRTLGHYHILEQTGAGGMGVVYRARDQELEREVALKFLPAVSEGDAAARARLLQEARTASALNHPHICTIHEIGHAEGRDFIVMEYIQGRPLQEQLKSGPLPAENLIRFGLQIADALAHAHEHGIIHRDLKTSNVMVTPEGRAKVLDFGLAQRLQKEVLDEVTRSQDTLTSNERLAGTVQYMAPELLRGLPADARSDVWALGIALHEMATGSLPFSGRTGYELTSAILRDAPPPLPADVPPAVREIIRRCLAKEPAVRYQSAREVRAALEAAASGRIPAAEVGATPKARTKRWAFATGALVLIVAVLAIARIQNWFPFAGKRQGIHSLAVLPLRNLSGSADEEFLVDGLTEALTTELAKFSSIKVIAPASAMRFKGSQKTLPQIAKELRVDGLVTGSMLRSGERVGITAQLVEASTEHQLWAKRYERDMRDVLSLCGELTGEIGKQIHLTVTPREKERLASPRRVDPRAYESYLKGRFYWNRYDYKRALDSFRQAIEFDPAYALAYVGLADTYWGMSSLVLPVHEAMPKARAAAKKAVELDASLAEAQASLANVQMVYDWNWAEAEQGFRRAIEQNPNYSTAHQWYGLYLVYVGRFEEAQRRFSTAVMLDPLSPTIAATAGWAYYHSRRTDEAIMEAKQTIDLDPGFFPGYLTLGLAYEQKGMLKEAGAAYEKAFALSNFVSTKAFVARAHALTGRKVEARNILRELEAPAALTPASSYLIAIAYVALNDKDRAFHWLERAYADRSEELLILKVDPKLDPVRSDPRYADLLRRVGFPQ